VSALVLHCNVCILKEESFPESQSDTLDFIVDFVHPNVVELLLLIENQVLKFICEFFELKLLPDVN